MAKNVKRIAKGLGAKSPDDAASHTMVARPFRR